MIFDFFDSPELLDIQRKGFHRFLKEDIPQLLAKEFPIKVLHGNYEIFLCLNEKNIKLIAPEDSPRDCILKMKTYNCKLYAQVKIVCKKSSNFRDDSMKNPLQIEDLSGLKFTNQEKKDEINFLNESIAFGDYHTDQKVAFVREKSDIVYESLPEWVLLGQLPIMTKRGHFIINGSPRVIVHQVVRSPGIYFQKLIKKDDQNRARFYGDIIPLKGVWVRLQMTKKGRVEAKFKKGKKVEVELLQKCLQVIESQTLLDSKLSLFLRSSYLFSSFLQILPSVTSKALSSKKSFTHKKEENTRSFRESAYEKLLGNKKSRAESKAEHDAFVHTYDKLYRTTQDKELEDWQKKKKNQKFFKEKGLCGSKVFGVTEQKAFRSRLAKIQKPERLPKQNETLHRFGGNDIEAINNFESIGQNSFNKKGSSLSEPKTLGEEYLEQKKNDNGLNSFYGHSTQNDNPLKIENLLGLGSQEPSFENQRQDRKKKTDLRSTFSSQPNEKKNNATLNGFGGSSSKKAKDLSFTEQNDFRYPGVLQNVSMNTAYKKASFSKNGGDFVLEPAQQKKVRFLLSKKEKMYGSLFCKKGISARSKRAFGTRKPENAFKRKKCSEALFATFKSSSRYSLGKLGREKINNRFGLVSREQEMMSLSSLMKEMRNQTKVLNNQVFGEKKRFSVYKNEFLDKVYTTQLTSLDLCYATIWLYRLRKGEESTDDIDHSQNRRVRTSGELLQTQFENGVYRLKNLLSTKLREWKGDMSASSFSKFFKESYKPRYNHKYIIKSGADRLCRRFTSTNLLVRRFVSKVKLTPSFRKSQNRLKYACAAVPKEALAGNELTLLSLRPHKYKSTISKKICTSKKAIKSSYLATILLGDHREAKAKNRSLCFYKKKVVVAKSALSQRQWLQVQQKQNKRFAGALFFKGNLAKQKQTTFLSRFSPKQFFTPSKVKKAFGNSKLLLSRGNGEYKSTICKGFATKNKFRFPQQKQTKVLKNQIFQEKKEKPKFCVHTKQNLFTNTVSRRLGQRYDYKISIPTIKELFSTKPITGALREFFGSNPLSQYMDQTNPLAEITHKRRISSLGLGGVSRDSAGMAIRGIHPTHYGRICPIETPEGKNAGLVNSLAFYTKVDESGFLKTPYYRVFKGQIQASLGFSFCSAKEESATGLQIAPSDLQKSFSNVLRTKTSTLSSVPVRVADNFLDVFKKENPYNVQLIAISPIQMISVATSLIPFLEHNDANRALMGSNMQRQAVPLMISERPVVGTGLESTVIVESGHITESQISGFASHVTANQVVIDRLLQKVSRASSCKAPLHNPGFCKNRKLNLYKTGDKVFSPQTKQSFVKRFGYTKFAHKAHLKFVTGDTTRETKTDKKQFHLSPKVRSYSKGLWKEQLLVFANGLGKGQSVPSWKNSRHFSQKKEGSFLHSTVSLLTTFSRSNQNTSITEKPLLREFDWVQRGDILTDCSASNKGELAVGKNVLLAYIPWEGYNFEDAIVISDRLVREHVYTSLHIERYVFQAQDLKEGAEWFTKHLPGVKPFLIQHLEESGLPKIGSFLKEGDIIVGKIRYLAKKPSSPYERLLCDILGEKNFAARNKSLYVPKGVEARVIYHKVISAFENDLENKVRPPEAAKTVHIFLGEKRVIQVGDKISGRHGNKGVISTILPRQDMPYLPDGTPIDLILNPLGVPSRMNVGQVLECLLGLAASYLDSHFKITAFDEKYGVEASKSIVFLKLYQARLMSGQNWLFQVAFPGKTRLVDGRSGECFDQWITVGKAYILKLIHMVSEKIHARSTGPYALITQQPLRGRSNKGGQRLGEMEVWALEGFGAAYTLQELLTKKSDDFFGRKQIVDSILPNPASIIDRLEPSYRIAKGRDVLGHPEIFKVLLCELQALCLDLGVYIVTPESFQRTFLGVVH